MAYQNAVAKAVPLLQERLRLFPPEGAQSTVVPEVWWVGGNAGSLQALRRSVQDRQMVRPCEPARSLQATPALCADRFLGFGVPVTLIRT